MNDSQISSTVLIIHFSFWNILVYRVNLYKWGFFMFSVSIIALEKLKGQIQNKEFL